MTDEALPDPAPAEKPKRKYKKRKRKYKRTYKPPGNPALRNMPASNRIALYRDELAKSLPKNFPAEKVNELLLKLYDDAMSGNEGWRESAKIVLDRILGKPKVEAEVTVNSSTTYELRLNAALIAAKLRRADDEDPDVIDGTVIDGTGERAVGDRKIFSALPAPDHRGSDAVPRDPEGSADGDHVLPLVQEREEAGA
jgi:hypothetical protein